MIATPPVNDRLRRVAETSTTNSTMMVRIIVLRVSCVAPELSQAAVTSRQALLTRRLDPCQVGFYAQGLEALHHFFGNHSVRAIPTQRARRSLQVREVESSPA